MNIHTISSALVRQNCVLLRIWVEQVSGKILLNTYENDWFVKMAAESCGNQGDKNRSNSTHFILLDRKHNVFIFKGSIMYVFRNKTVHKTIIVNKPITPNKTVHVNNTTPVHKAISVQKAVTVHKATTGTRQLLYIKPQSS